MVRVFEIIPDDSGWGKTHSYLIEAVPAVSLPGVSCPVCGAWATTGIQYPSVDASLVSSKLTNVPRTPVPLEEFDKMVRILRPILGVSRPVEPGASFGPLRGVATGRLGDFAWCNPWTVLLRESVWSRMRSWGIDVVGVPADLQFRDGEEESFVELEALPRANLERSLIPEACGTCGRLPIKKPDRLVLAASTFDRSIPLQRIRQLPTVFVVNEPFADYVRDNRLRDALLLPIELA